MVLLLLVLKALLLLLEITVTGDLINDRMATSRLAATMEPVVLLTQSTLGLLIS